MVRVLVVGSANVDFVVQAPHIPQPGETVLGRSFVMAMGGKGANQAVGAARLGAEVIFLARVGQDIFGDRCLEAFQAEGMVTDLVGRDPDEATGVALITVADSGENSITVASGANMRLMPAHVESAGPIFRTIDVLLLQLEIPLETGILAAHLARENGAIVILNPAPARLLPMEMLRMVDVLTPNRIELAQLAGLPEIEVQAMTDEQLAHLALSLGVSSAVITLGEQGALAVGSWGRARVQPFAVMPVDTTAAGDAFNAGLAVALGSRSRSLVEAARYANACGALATTRMGAQPSLPSRAVVESFIGEQAEGRT